MHDDTYYRDKILDLEDRLDSLDAPTEGSASALVQTVSVSSYPTTAFTFYAVQPLVIDGVEREGAAASFGPDPSRVFYACNLGSVVPPVGTKLVVTSCGGRWVFTFNG